MLTGFENFTYELTDYEKSLVPKFVNSFKKRSGKDSAITNKQIVRLLKGKYEVTEPRVRKIINYIRVNNLVPGLVATSKGYYVSHNPQELKKYIKSLDGRVNEITRVRDSMQNYLRELVTGKPLKLYFDKTTT